MDVPRPETLTQSMGKLTGFGTVRALELVAVPWTLKGIANWGFPGRLGWLVSVNTLNMKKAAMAMATPAAAYIGILMGRLRIPCRLMLLSNLILLPPPRQ